MRMRGALYGAFLTPSVSEGTFGPGGGLCTKETRS